MRELGYTYPSSHQVIHGPVLKPQDTYTGAQKEEGNVLRPRKRGKIGIRTTHLLQCPHLRVWDGKRGPT